MAMNGLSEYERKVLENQRDIMCVLWGIVGSTCGKNVKELLSDRVESMLMGTEKMLDDDLIEKANAIIGGLKND